MATRATYRLPPALAAASALADHEVPPADLALEAVGAQVRAEVSRRLGSLELAGGAGVVAEVGAVLLQGPGQRQGGTREPPTGEVDVRADGDPFALGTPADLAGLCSDHRAPEALGAPGLDEVHVQHVAEPGVAGHRRVQQVPPNHHRVEDPTA